ncbi:hypothetical protein SKTS_33020 [Sulfurimicrobium lacus]|uniref:DNA-binding protein H-NS-like C-terminal domain-containing protein n=1 Tax=Sulfurimicrobium lacus TaxID=2715678 RepID=A0A6F8VHB4_9PROT|nr:H-NS family nucleoid-associated regulatory protein [Sulfurimicrobium lacus]BCB28416.1 hypothetical protein SKTS_33020 [Sulfurimicrobium lacus]
MPSSIKYTHPQNPDLQWTGKGRKPIWVDRWLNDGGTLEQLESAPDTKDYDLGITDGVVTQPALGEQLYADRIAAGQASMPDEDDPSFTPGVRAALEEALNRNRSRIESATMQAVQASHRSDSSKLDFSDDKLQVCLSEFGFSALTADEFMQAGVDESNKSLLHACRAGTAFWAAQEALKLSTTPGVVDNSDTSTPGVLDTFKEWIGERGLSKPRVYEAIRLAKFYSRLPEESRSQMLSIGKKQALLLASLSQEVIDQAAECGNDLIGKADLMTVAELKGEIASLQRREKNYEAELERAGNQIKRLSEAKKRTTDFLLRTEELREECMALQLGGELHLNGLRKLFDDTDTQAPEGGLQAEHVWIAANTLAARALDLVEYLHARMPEGAPDRPLARHLLTPDEAERWMLDYPLIENRHAAEAAVRESRREATRPRGPGRPKGSANKAAGE